VGVTLLACEGKRKGEEREDGNVVKWVLFWGFYFRFCGVIGGGLLGTVPEFHF